MAGMRTRGGVVADERLGRVTVTLCRVRVVGLEKRDKERVGVAIMCGRGPERFADVLVKEGEKSGQG